MNLVSMNLFISYFLFMHVLSFNARIDFWRKENCSDGTFMMSKMIFGEKRIVPTVLL